MKPRASFFFPRHRSLQPRFWSQPARLPVVNVFRGCSNWFFLAGLCAAASVPPEFAAAEERDRWSVDGPDFVLTPSRLPQRLDESPSSVTVIDRAMIAASGARRLEEVLRLVPGFQVGYKYNNQPTVAYHGLSDEFARRVLVLVNGQRIFQYSGGGVDWNNLPVPLQDIERIEVVRGPSAAAYGSNALTAVINIQTGSAAEYAGLSAQAGGGTNRTADGFFRWGGKAGIFDYALSVTSQGEGGYPHIHDDRRNDVVLFMGDLPLGQYGELQLMAGYARGDYQAQNVNPAYPGTFERDFTDTNGFESLQWRYAFTPDDELLFSLAHDRVHHGDPGFSSTAVIPGVLLNIDFQFEEEREEMQLQYARRFSDRWRAVTGLGYYRDAYRSLYYLNTNDQAVTDITQIFGHGEYRPWENLVFNLGAMVERAPLSDEWLFLPRASAHWHLDDHHTLRLIYSTGSRQPSVYENQGQAIIKGVNVPLTLFRVYATGIDHGGLSPERNRSLELGYFWRPTPAVNLDLRVFDERIDDYIVAYDRPETRYRTVLPGNEVVDFHNVGPFAVRGLEAQFNWKNGRGTRLFGGYAWLETVADDPLLDREISESVPRNSVSLLLDQAFEDGWEASLVYKYQGAMRWYREAPLSSYHQLTGRVAKRFRWGKTAALAELVGGNLAGSVSDYLPERGWDRGLYVRFSIDY